jgi:hypothetical protein
MVVITERTYRPQAPRREAMQNFADTVPGTIPTGTEVPGLGTVEATSLTAYLIDGTWVPFHKVHGRPGPVLPLVTLG